MMKSRCSSSHAPSEIESSSYTIPSFGFFTVELQRVVVSGGIEADSVNRQHDVFLKSCCPEVDLSAPCSIIVLDSGYISDTYR